ncbi:biliverdin reductase A-like [Haliotis rufescens]|uniref:biliverdin reductase A-like n=1 Tax=Haliotis rufescens TaxID=6454 RepID=UPI00201ECF5F|nr:biliverdin reductase A-like [Haliotis rufescens]
MANTPRVFNIVVIGVGIAGRVRIRDLKEVEAAGKGLALTGFVSRRTLDIDGVRQLTLDEALQSPDVDGVAVCTEPGSHEDTVQKALNHNKHVLVEYPVAASPQTARQLYSLAAEKGLVLHEENIALLTEAHSRLKEKVATSTSRLKSGEIMLRGNYNGWIEDFSRSGLPFTTNVAVIQTVIAVFGKVTATHADMQTTEKGFVATGDVQTEAGSVIRLMSERYKEKVPRVKTLRFEFEDGSVFDTEGDKPPQSTPGPGETPKTAPGQGNQKKKGLFMQDLVLFLEKLQGQRPKSEGSELSVDALEVAVGLNSLIAAKT